MTIKAGRSARDAFWVLEGTISASVPLPRHRIANVDNLRLERALHPPNVLAPHHCLETRQVAAPVTRNDRTILLRDQLALRRGQVGLTDGWTWNDLLTAINSRVFFWPGTAIGPNR